MEHPCTEMISGVNLPAAQLQVAMGIPLDRMRDIRLLYNKEPSPFTPIDFHSEKELESRVTDSDASLVSGSSVSNKALTRQPKGHVIACRLTSENPDAGFKPSGGWMKELNFRSSSQVWGYFSVGAQSGLHEFADSQFGHLFARGDTRDEARRNLIVALKELSIRGEFWTTVEYLVELLESQHFAQNTIDTAWLDLLISQNSTRPPKPHKAVVVISGVAIKSLQEFSAQEKLFTDALERGQNLSREFLKTQRSMDLVYDRMRYDFHVARTGSDTLKLEINGSAVDVHLRILNDGGWLVLLDGKSHTVFCQEEARHTRLEIDGRTCLVGKENDPTLLQSPSAGKLIRFVVGDGEVVGAGAPFAEIEVCAVQNSDVWSGAACVDLSLILGDENGHGRVC